uniref:EF-hand domain-containing protein n=1 Tax=Neogobius melanostomus TaxID=47308 RepID=A0A8C6S3N0_9GOBI
MANAPALPSAISTIMQVFDKYAGKDGNKDKLSKSEMKELIQAEMAPMLKDSKNPGQVDELFKCMDANGDDQVDFPEFMIALACLACICHGKECDMSKCKK